MSTPVPIVLVSELFPPEIGGSGVLLDNVYSRLGDLGITVLASGERPASTERPGMVVERVEMTAPDWGVLRPPGLWRHLRVAARIRRAAVGRAVVYCGRGLPEGLSARIAAVGRHLPYVCWIHGEELGFSSTSRELSALLRHTYRHAAAVIANSHNSAHLLGRWGVPIEKVTVVHPGVDVERFRPDVCGERVRRRMAPDGELLLLSVGRLQRRKGHDTVIEALARLGSGPPRLRYVVAGDGPYRPALEQQARAAGVADRVVFAGAIPEEELPAYYAASDVFVLPNRSDGVDFEGFGIVFLEAAASARAAIGGRSGGVPEAVEEGVTGLLVDGRDAGDLVSAIERLASSPDLRARLGAAGRARVTRDFTWMRAADLVRGLHERLSSV